MQFSQVEDVFNFFYVRAHLDALPSVRKLAWLHYPNVFYFLQFVLRLLLLQSLDLLVDRQHLLLSFVVGLDELVQLVRVVLSLDMERQWMKIENVHFLRLEIAAQIVEQSLFIAQVEVVLQVVVDFKVLRLVDDLNVGHKLGDLALI